MNKFTRFIQNYLMLGFPFVVACILWETYSPEVANGHFSSIVAKLLWQALGINVMAWFSSLLLYIGLLVVMPSIREKTILRIANLKERDEREEYITGKASRATYISTLSLTILLLFLSLFYVSAEKHVKAEKGHQTVLSIGMGFNMVNQSYVVDTPDKKVLFDSRNYMLSNSAMILILLGWQLLSFHLAARREQL